MPDPNMKSEITLTLRAFPVLAHDHRTSKEAGLTVVLTKEQLRTAQTVGQSSKELIECICDRQGYTVIEVGKPDKRTVIVDLNNLVGAEGTLNG